MTVLVLDDLRWRSCASTATQMKMAALRVAHPAEIS